MTWYDLLPKIELHIHLEGAIPLKALWELIQKYGGDNSVDNIEDLEERFVFRDFTHFLETWTWKNQYLREYEDFTFISELIAKDLLSQNIKYVEMFFSPSEFTSHGLEVQELTEAIRKGLSNVPGIKVALIADLVRNYGPEREMIILEKLNEVKDSGVIGIGIGGSEKSFPPEIFEPVFVKAREFGFHTNAHAGEGAGKESIWGAISVLKVDRIGHGTRAFEDKQLIQLLSEERIPLEMCPASNVCTGVVDRIENHPIKDYFGEGLLVTVNTDDPKMFNTGLANEYQLLVEHCGFSKADICKLILNGIEASWLPDEQRLEYIDIFKNDESWIEHD